MGFSFSKEFSSNNYSVIENTFIKDYLPLSSGDAVRVYLYGLYLCGKDGEKDVGEIASNLNLTEEEVLDAFKFWEEYELLQILSLSPLEIVYMPVRTAHYVKPRKIKAEKYTEFSKGLQAMLPNRMIGTNEYTEYFNIMETYGIKPEAMLMIIKYCIDVKGENISYRYVSTVAKDYGNRDITTCEKVEKELSSYLLHQYTLEKILSSLKLKRKPEIDDLNLFKKWTISLGFEPEIIIFAAKTVKKGGMNKLDELMLELYSTKRFTKSEITEHLDKKQQVYDLALKINRALSVYVDVLETEIDTYLNKWLSYGYEENGLIQIANVLFRKGENTLLNMDELIDKLRQEGVVENASIIDYFEREKASYEFIKKVLSACGVSRRPNGWDINNVSVWKKWNFSEEMILEAAKLSSGKSSPIAYLNGVLSNWKNNGIFSLEEIENKTENTATNAVIDYNREYERRRSVAVSRAGQNLDNAMKIKGFSEVYQRLFSIEKELAFAEIEENLDLLESLKNERKEVEKSVSKMLSTINLTITDLSPDYLCKKCKDTGYVGTEKCDCYEKFLEK